MSYDTFAQDFAGSVTQCVYCGRWSVVCYCDHANSQRNRRALERKQRAEVAREFNASPTWEDHLDDLAEGRIHG